MRLTVGAAIALFVATGVTTASAGVVISEDVVNSTGNAGAIKTQETVMVQGNKRRLITPDRIIITDLDAGMMYVLAPKEKKSAQIPLPPTGVILTMMAKQGMSVELNKAPGTRKVAGYQCQDYAGAEKLGHYNLDSTQCVAATAPGAQEYLAFMKGFAAKLKGTPIEPKGEIPNGIPLSSKVTATFIPLPIPRNFPPDLTAKVNAQNAKIKPQVTQTTVTKIQVQEIAANEFVVPAEYKAMATPSPQFKEGVPGGPQPKPMPSMVLPESVLKLLPHASPAAPAAQPTH
jgi:hypothetical protein